MLTQSAEVVKDAANNMTVGTISRILTSTFTISQMHRETDCII